jgi:catechol 2,3-dioxygenase-like lactoylglutathione lyase family enzyme
MLSKSLLICVSLALHLGAQAGARAAQPSPVTARGAFFALSVADLRATAAWYRATFGLEVVMDEAGRGAIPAVVVLEGRGLVVELMQSANPTAARASSSGSEGAPRLFKTGVIVEDFDGTVTMLKARGVAIVAGPFPPAPMRRANVLIRDIEGNLIQFLGPAR